MGKTICSLDDIHGAAIMVTWRNSVGHLPRFRAPLLAVLIILVTMGSVKPQNDQVITEKPDIKSSLDSQYEQQTEVYLGAQPRMFFAPTLMPNDKEVEEHGNQSLLTTSMNVKNLDVRPYNLSSAGEHNVTNVQPENYHSDSIVESKLNEQQSPSKTKTFLEPTPSSLIYTSTPFLTQKTNSRTSALVIEHPTELMQGDRPMPPGGSVDSDRTESVRHMALPSALQKPNPEINSSTSLLPVSLGLPNVTKVTPELESSMSSSFPTIINSVSNKEIKSTITAFDTGVVILVTPLVGVVITSPIVSKSPKYEQYTHIASVDRHISTSPSTTSSLRVTATLSSRRHLGSEKIDMNLTEQLYDSQTGNVDAALTEYEIDSTAAVATSDLGAHMGLSSASLLNITASASYTSASGLVMTLSTATDTVVLEPSTDSHVQAEDHNLPAGTVVGIVIASIGFVAILASALGLLIFRRLRGVGNKTYDNKLSGDNCSYLDNLQVSYINNHIEIPKESSDEMFSLDNDSFLNSLEAMTMENYWAEDSRSTKV